ncbi:Glycosyltransferase involved in cell wall bisynthesis [Tessaracoccus bendigoensis DSM 12906]|uniref:Glycosyltransferase involved in cell wall bisynthesis n=1 Tax=Tessaracoccus bendigoensis DSM 12906 TaxID=1123357 RepID=A0A1M6K7F2_9ACTN|nr:glycosyltransferase family 4 protein [Tessaracoccus bendigoensis]SHJ54875.1 Glycosyltransferase involved in cell wall bisynthesis [Tessaracoccus bendigoensis DSM 12906]
MKIETDGRAPRALFTATVLSHIAQFHQPAIDLLKQAGYEIHVAARNNLDQKPGLELIGVDRVIEVPFERSPFTPRNLLAVRRLRQVLRDTDYDLIHCNTPVAGLLTRLCGQRSRGRGARMVYTAHGFHFFKGAPLLNWLLYWPLELLSAFGTDVLVTINREDRLRAARFPARAVEYIPGVGVDLARFSSSSADRSEVRRSLGLSDGDFVVLSIGELNDNKNHQTVIKALAATTTPGLQYLICGNGPRRDDLERLAGELGLKDRVRFLGYRRDIPELLAASDAFCLPSIREGLPMSLMEAMAAGLPVIGSRIRGSVDLVDVGRGGLLVAAADDRAAFTAALDVLGADSAMAAAMGSYNVGRVQDFSTDTVTSALAKVYGLKLTDEAGAE